MKANMTMSSTPGAQAPEQIAETAETHIARLNGLGVEDRDEMLKATVRYLTDQCGCTRRAAKLHAAKAIGEHAARGTPARVDVDKTTSTCVFVNCNGELRALTIPDLVHALEHSPQAH